MFADASEHLSAELERLDLLLYLQILRLRATYQLSQDEFRGLYISDEEVDALISRATTKEDAAPAISTLLAQAEARRRANANQAGDALPWRHIVAAFNLSPFEQDVLLLALAPEIDLKYETIYAYLNNDVTRKWPTFDMALRLFSRNAAQRLEQRAYLLPEAMLFRYGLLQPVQPAQEHPSWLTRGFAINPPVAQRILGLPPSDPHLESFVEHLIPSIAWDEVPLSQELVTALGQASNLFAHVPPGKSPPVLIFEGQPGAGRSLSAEAICKDLGRSMLYVNIEALWATPEQRPHVAQGLLLQQRLQRVGIYLEHGDTFFDREGNPLAESRRFIKQLAQGDGPIFLACSPGTRWGDLLQGYRALAFQFGNPDYKERRRLWQMYIEQEGYSVPKETLEALADRFVLNPGQVKAAISSVMDRCCTNQGPLESMSFAMLAEAARTQSDQSLGNLATKVATLHNWDDLVLPPVTLRHVREVAAAIKYRNLVYSQWGFAQRVASGMGLKVLFAGPAGTGKTMTAGVIARDLGLDLYKIDLSGVVSKYIGETEKNLDRIFRAAHDSNAILFFDEADALFGKRSEVKDAHDRYANIEVAYLLQKMEEHEGVVILASNLSKNIDEAFSRRVQYVVEFPLPDEKHRERLWRGMFPAQVPLSDDVDFSFLARQFQIAGGDIKNVVLDAAFLAAQDGQLVTMKQLIKAMARQMMKQGKLVSPTDFKQYHSLLSREE